MGFNTIIFFVMFCDFSFIFQYQLMAYRQQSHRFYGCEIRCKVCPLNFFIIVIYHHKREVRNKKPSGEEISALHCYYFGLKPKHVIGIFV